MSEIHSKNKGRVFITGISGFIASELAEKLLIGGYEVAGLVRQSTRENQAIKNLRGKVTFYQGDLRDYWALKKALDDFQPEYICHLGAITPVSYSFEHPYEVTEVNYIGTINLVEAAKKSVPLLKKFIFAGSMEEYGFQPEHYQIKEWWKTDCSAIQEKIDTKGRFKAFTEERELKPACPYAVAKVASEKYLQYSHFAYGFPAVIFRQTNCYGRKENDYFVIEAIITKMLKNIREVNLGRKEPVRNFIHIDDLIHAYVDVLESEKGRILGEVFNLGPANGLTIYELAKKIAEKIGWKGSINWNTIELRPGEIFYLNSLNEKLTHLIGWKPLIDLDTGLDRTIEFWRDKFSRVRWEPPY